jgi:DNA-binding PadR family transcriptional regulator
MAGVLSRMEELGLVARRRVRRDQRRVLVSLTSKARAMADRMAPQIDATYRRIERKIGVQFNANFQQTLDQLLATLDAHIPRPEQRAGSSTARRRRRRGAVTRSAVQQEPAEGRSYEQA